MTIFRRSARHIPNTARPWVWPALLLAWVWLPSVASAVCIPSPDPGIRPLQAMVPKDALKALGQVRAKLDGLSHGVPQPSNAYLAGLYAVQAEAYALLELSAEARTAASEGLNLAPDMHDPLHLQLLAAYAGSAFEGPAIAAAITSMETSRAAQIPGSLPEVCLLITRGLLENREDRADLAIVTLTQAYSATKSPSMTEAHVYSAAVLSIVMRSMGDYAQALELNQQEIDWNTSHHATLGLSLARFMRGRILTLMGSHAAAVGEFTEARRLSAQVDDEQGMAFADLGTCGAHVELDELNLAQQECTDAIRVFSAAHSTASVKEARALLARIDLKQGRPESALGILNGVLDQNGADLLPLHVAPLYEARALANAALHRYGNAYRDLKESVERHVAASTAERYRQAGALRARFETDREIERNAALERQLSVSREQSDRQAQQLRWNAIVVVVGVCVIALLIYFLVTNLRFRRQLQQLAHHDGLTGLPNRRRTAELALAALETARATQQPLAVAIIDMDHFKVINDRCGHATGDHVLKEFARTGVAALRATDVLGRWGGEEFLLVMPGTTLEAAVANLERLRTLVCGIRLPASGVGLRVSLSAGVASLDMNVKSLDDLIARADGALYAAKNAGRDMVRIADPAYVTGSHAIRRVQRQ
jgi:diguanylate cyclase (GGDEF)-like protein